MSDFNAISRLQEEQERSLKNCEAMIEKWEKFKEDYETVDKLLNDLPKKTTHDVMVPIGPLAFMPGNLIHTNEIIILLGDNWFAERSATQAIDIAKRRLKSVEDYLSNLHKEHANILSHMSFTNEVVTMRTQNDFQEIKEELTEKDRERQVKKSRRVAHAKATKHSVKKVDLPNSSSSRQAKSKEDKDLFARLEELERQEEINKELENEQYFADSVACNTATSNEETIREHDKSTCAQKTSTKNGNINTLHAGNKTNPSSTNVSTCSSSKQHSEKPCKVKKQSDSHAVKNCSFKNVHEADWSATQAEQNDVEETYSVGEDSTGLHKQRLVKKVSWKEDIVEKEGEDRVAKPKSENATIYFTHSSGKVTGPERKESHEETESITSPADILTHYLAKTTQQCPEPVLKNSMDEKSSMLKVAELKQGSMTEKDTEEKQIQEIPQAFSDVVVEHKDLPSSGANTEKEKERNTETRKISKFKARRIKND